MTSGSLTEPLPSMSEDGSGSAGNSWNAGPEEAVKLDHKVWFSAERTTIQWLKMGIEVGGVGLALSASGRAEFETTGALLLVPGLVLLAVAAAQYRARHVALRDQDASVLRRTRLPLVVTCVLTATIVANFVFAWWRAATLAADESRRATPLPKAHR